MRRIDPGTGLTRPRCYGFTLTELLIVLAIAVVVLGIGIPGLAAVADRHRAMNAMLELRALLNLARQTAMTRRIEVTLCGSADDMRCANRWEGIPTLVFADDNTNRQLDAGETLLANSALTRSGRVRWRASGGRDYLRFRPDGSVREIGSFVYCPRDGDARHARALIVSFTGRTRGAEDRDGDGVVEDAVGAAVRCEN